MKTFGLPSAAFKVLLTRKGSDELTNYLKVVALWLHACIDINPQCSVIRKIPCYWSDLLSATRFTIYLVVAVVAIIILNNNALNKCTKKNGETNADQKEKDSRTETALPAPLEGIHDCFFWRCFSLPPPFCPKMGQIPMQLISSFVCVGIG